MVTASPSARYSTYHAAMPEGPGTAPVIRVLIADQIAHIVEDLAKLADFSDQVDVCGIARHDDDVIEEARLRRPDVLLVSSAMGGADAATLAAQLADAAPGAKILFVTPPGVEDGVAAPEIGETVAPSTTGAELVAAIRRAHGVDAHEPAVAAEPEEPMQEIIPRRPRRAGRTRGEIFLVYSGKGGVGKSMIATNLAVGLSIDTGARVALVDLDLQYGDAGVMMQVDKHLTSIEDLAQHGEVVDPEVLQEVLATGPASVRVLLAPASPELADLVTTANLRAILRELGKTHDYIVVDAPAHLEERTLEVIEQADQILVVTAFNVTAVKSTRVALKLFQSLGVEMDRIAIVLNQSRQKVTFARGDIEQLLRFRVLVQLPFDTRVDESIDHGQPLVMSEPRSEMSKQFRALVDYLTPDAAETDRAHADDRARVPASRRRFSLGRRQS